MKIREIVDKLKPYSLKGGAYTENQVDLFLLNNDFIAVIDIPSGFDDGVNEKRRLEGFLTRRGFIRTTIGTYKLVVTDLEKDYLKKELWEQKR